MNKISFGYKNYREDPSPEVLVTTQNQHIIRGFNINYITKGQATRIENEWMRIRNQRWSTKTKERVIINRIGSPARRSFRTYRTESIARMD
mgnify:CR=1 FL=1|tara:strand:+ start:1338 stop:1610 length:273 start_codon:yes stop_codon:yes gene_type:complete